MDGWLGRLQQECERRGQSAVARELGLSPATVSLVLRGKYPADDRAIREKVERQYGEDHAACPELGMISFKVCAGHQAQGFSTASPQRARIWRACRSGCRHYKDGRE